MVFLRLRRSRADRSRSPDFNFVQNLQKSFCNKILREIYVLLCVDNNCADCLDAVFYASTKERFELSVSEILQSITRNRLNLLSQIAECNSSTCFESSWN